MKLKKVVSQMWSGGHTFNIFDSKLLAYKAVLRPALNPESYTRELFDSDLAKGQSYLACTAFYTSVSAVMQC